MASDEGPDDIDATGEGPGDHAAPTDRPDDASIRYEWGEMEEPSTAVVRAVATTTGRDATELPLLYDLLDGAALDRLLARSTDLANGRVRVAFAYAGVEVAVDSEGAVEVWTDGSEPG